MGSSLQGTGVGAEWTPLSLGQAADQAAEGAGRRSLCLGLNRGGRLTPWIWVVAQKGLASPAGRAAVRLWAGHLTSWSRLLPVGKRDTHTGGLRWALGSWAGAAS